MIQTSTDPAGPPDPRVRPRDRRLVSARRRARRLPVPQCAARGARRRPDHPLFKPRTRPRHQRRPVRRAHAAGLRGVRADRRRGRPGRERRSSRAPRAARPDQGRARRCPHPPDHDRARRRARRPAVAPVGGAGRPARARARRRGRDLARRGDRRPAPSRAGARDRSPAAGGDRVGRRLVPRRRRAQTGARSRRGGGRDLGRGGAGQRRRLSVPETGEELADLARHLNELLARIEAALEHERAFLDDASHDLRTPISIVRSELELARMQTEAGSELARGARFLAGRSRPARPAGGEPARPGALALRRAAPAPAGRARRAVTPARPRP